jgi:anti-sigma regulatory factor (Ser/Thr protein kinase)
MPRFVVTDPVDVFHVQRGVSTFAQTLGFLRRECSELAIVASELTSNILKYGTRGSLDADAFHDPSGSGLALIATDGGPPFHDLALALQDGWNDRGPIDPLHMLKRRGIGAGLGAIARLSHSISVETLPVGKRVHVRRYLGRRLPTPTQ